MSQIPGINAYDKPVENDFEYVYTENKNKGFRKVTKAMMKVLLGVATKLSELENDKGFVDNTVNDLKNYYLKTETYSKDELDNKLSLVPRFSVQVVTSLPTENISDTTVYLVPAGEDAHNLYTEYINVDGLWEILGTQKSAFSGNASDVTYDDTETKLGATNVQDAIVKLSETVNDQKTQINGKEESGTAETKVSQHNVSETSHEDIRLLISNLINRINGILDSEDVDLDQLSELVAYIKSNRTLIEQVTTNKINVSDIIDNLETSVSDKPLSAKQGVVLKGLIDAIDLSKYALKTELPSVPTTLPNPKALTFTGAVTGIYDGSEALMLDIPSGGGSSGVTEPTLPEDILLITLKEEQAGASTITFTKEEYPKLSDFNTINILIKPPTNTNCPWIETYVNNKFVIRNGSGSSGKKIRLCKKGKMFIGYGHNENPTLVNIPLLNESYMIISSISPFWRECGETIESIELKSYTAWTEAGTKIYMYGYNE